MLRDPSVKYRPLFPAGRPARPQQWPSKTITKAPRWLSTDMRDGNQALIDPMDAEKKQRFFDLLCKVGIKEIEVGFPSAGATEFDFISGLVQKDKIPDDVIVQVLTQSRQDLIETSFESLKGAKKAIVHLYNAVSPAWRRIVFGMAAPRSRASRSPAPRCCATRPPSSPIPTGISNTAPRPSPPPSSISPRGLRGGDGHPAARPRRPLILNLPATVEMATPNVYADQIEWLCRNISTAAKPDHLACIRTMTAAPASPPPNWRCWPAPTASRAACSAMASAPAMSIW
jgi:2-isopropylmalate synthase